MGMQVGELKGTTVLRHDLFTNDVLYAEIAFNLRTVKADLLPLVPLFWLLPDNFTDIYLKDCSFIHVHIRTPCVFLTLRGMC